MKSNESQSQAITHVAGPMMVIAGPGSGKTTVICRRIKYLIESAGVSPADILVITFTKAAAVEMEQRFRRLVAGKDYKVRFGTFHSVFFWIIKTAYGLSNSSVILEEEKRRLLDQILREMKVSYDNKEDIISSVISQISLVKCDMIEIENYYSKDMPEYEFRELYRKFDRALKRTGKIDFDDMMVMCYELLINRPDILEKCRRLFPYIMVDEFQDSNRIQYEILKLLATPENHVFVVGDDDQSVYGFRGARPEIMQQFRRDFPSCKLVYLNENYRCDRLITESSAFVIGKNRRRFKKKLAAVQEETGCLRILTPKDEGQEYQEIVEQIKNHVATGGSYEEQAVLYRTNLQPRRLAYKLNQYNIPYTLRDALPNIFDHFAVRGVLDYMKIAMGDTSRGLFLRVLNKPSRYISREYLMEDPVDYDKLRFRLREKTYAVEQLDKYIADMRWVRKMRPYPALNYIRNAVGYDEYLKSYAEYRQMDAVEFLDVLDEFADMIRDMASFGELFEFIEEYKEFLIAKHKESQGRGKKKGVQLMTMHSAKGLEFDCVYLMDAVESVTPYKKAKTDAELEEERRMFYVAMTRARHELYVYSPGTIAGKLREKSRFVKDIEAYLQKH